MTSDGVAAAAFSACLCGRWLTPAEGVAFGDTLGWTTLMLAGAAVVGWLRRAEGRPALSIDRVTIGLTLIAAGYAASTACVFLFGGDRRVALNFAWESAGVVAGWCLLRASAGRRETDGLIAAMTAVAAGVAVVGVWQCFVFYPSVAAEYRSLREAEQAATAAGDAVALSAARRELVGMGAPEDPVMRRSWESRLLASREPFGFFALANTLGGQLAVASFAAAGFVSAWWKRDRRAAAVIAAAAVAVIALCLLLTKSRTAYAGVAAGCGVVAVSVAGGRLGRGRLLAAGGLAAAGFGLLLGVAWLAGGLDAEVLREAPKSLTVRRYYWSTAAEIVAENWTFGVGPGQFRSWYTTLKPPEASENVFGPHNILLEVWSAGGLLAFVGLGVFGFAAVRALLTPQEGLSSGDAADRSHDTGGRRADPVLWGFIAAVAAVGLVPPVLGQPFDGRLAGCVAVAWPLYLLLRGTGPASRFLAAGFAAIGVHLLGADGASFALVWLTALLCLAWAVRSDEPNFGDGRSTLWSWGFVVWGVAAAACGAGWWQVTQSRGLLASAEFAVATRGVDRGGFDALDEQFALAAAADPLSTEAAAARLEFLAIDLSSSDQVESVAAGYARLLARDPRSLRARLGRARFLAAVAGERDAAVTASAYDDLLALAPHDARFRAESALFRDRYGLAAADEAVRALEQDRLNRRLGHAEQFLTEPVVEDLRRLAGPRAVDGGEAREQD
ncbi:MAG: O-antigen ligase family protein [Planctomycetota bacterium]